MKKLLLVTALLAAATPAFALHIPIVTAKRAAQSQGNVVAVRGRALVQPDLSVEGTDVSLLNGNGNVVFIGFIPKGNEAPFGDLRRLDGRTVVMYGVVEFYRGVPATQLNYASQLHAG